MTKDSSQSKLKEQKFHSERMMFVLLDNEIRVAPAKTTMSHKEWFTARPELNIDYETVVRGYFKDGIICFYTGGDCFEAPAMRELFMDLAKQFKATAIQLGAVPAEPGHPWKPRQIIYL